MESKSVYDIIMQNRKELVDNLIEQMKSGNTVTQALWDKDITAPYNPLSNLPYRGGNKLKLMIASYQMGFTDPRWMTFQQAKNNNYKIRAGSKSVLLERWILTTEVAELDEHGNIMKDAEGNTIKKTVPLRKPMVNYFRVFNAEQITGIEPLPLPQLPRQELDIIADTFLQSSKCPILYSTEQRAYYSPMEDKIHLPLRESFKSSQAHLSVLIHEMAHSTGHESRLNRPLKNSFGTPDYAREELNAELSSFFSQSDLGIKMEPDSEHLKAHAGYIKSWIKILEKDPNALFVACANADKISHFLMQDYEQQLSLSQSNHLINEQTANVENKSQTLTDEPQKTPSKQNSDTYKRKLRQDLKKNGIKPNKSIMSSIEKLNGITNKKNTLKDIHSYYKENCYPSDSEAGKLVQSICTEFQHQQLIVTETVLQL